MQFLFILRKQLLPNIVAAWSEVRAVYEHLHFVSTGARNGLCSAFNYNSVRNTYDYEIPTSIYICVHTTC